MLGSGGRQSPWSWDLRRKGKAESFLLHGYLIFEFPERYCRNIASGFYVHSSIQRCSRIRILANSNTGNA